MDRLKLWIDKKIPSQSFLRNVITLLTGTTFAQVLLVIIAPILTRLYDPVYFGSYTMFTSILSIIAIISCFRYELAIVLPAKDEDAANILLLSIVICSSVSMVTLVFIALFREPISFLLGAPELQIWLWFLPLGVLMAGLFQAFNYWNARRRQFNRLAVRQITQSMVTATTQISFGSISKMQAGGLIEGHIAGQVASTGRLIMQTLKDEAKQIKTYLSFKRIKLNAMKYKNFPLYSSWSGLLNTASMMLPPLLLGYFFTPAVVGYYALGNRVLNIPLNIIGGAVAQAFFPHASEANSKGELPRITFEVFKNLLSIGLVPIILITLIAPELFVFIFGENWYEAGQYVRWMSLWLLFVFISSPLSSIYSVLVKQKIGLIMDILLFSSRLIVLIIGGLYGEALFTIALFGIVGALMWLINCIVILKLSGLSFNKILIEIIGEFFKAMPYTALTICSLILFDSSLILILSAILSGLIFFFLQIKKIRSLLV